MPLIDQHQVLPSREQQIFALEQDLTTQPLAAAANNADRFISLLPSINPATLEAKAAKAQQAINNQQMTARLERLTAEVNQLARQKPADGRLGLVLSGDMDIAVLEPLLPQILPLVDVIAIDFAGFRDGRGYSLAQALRLQPEFGNIVLQARGDILPDTLEPLAQVGFGEFFIEDAAFDATWFGYFASIRHAYNGRDVQQLPMFANVATK